MNELKIIANNTTPAKVEFNYKEIEEQLSKVLAKYVGLVFTDETVKDCKKSIADLRKGQKSLDDFRKDTKKILTESVTVFENDCKVLYKKFDEVIDPLKEQADYFETLRKEEKKKSVEILLEQVAGAYKLNRKYTDMLLIEDGFLNSSVSITKVKEQLSVMADKLRAEQRKDEEDVLTITSTVETVNKEAEINLLVDNYTRLLQYEYATKVISKIYEDASQLVKVKEAEKLRLEKIESERIAKEEEEQRLAASVEEYAEWELSKEPTQEPISEDEFNELPTEAALITKTIKVTGDANQMGNLELFLNAVFDKWEEI